MSNDEYLFTTPKDTGERVQMGEAVREHQYPPFELIDFDTIRVLAERLQLGAEKYGIDNWKKGNDQFFQDAPRHIVQHVFDYMQGKFDNGEKALDHLGGILFGAMVLIWWEIQKEIVEVP